MSDPNDIIINSNGKAPKKAVQIVVSEAQQAWLRDKGNITKTILDALSAQYPEFPRDERGRGGRNYEPRINKGRQKVPFRIALWNGGNIVEGSMADVKIKNRLSGLIGMYGGQKWRFYEKPNTVEAREKAFEFIRNNNF